MWKLLQRKGTVSALPAVGNGGLGAITRLWQSEKARPRRVVAMATQGSDDPEATQRLPIPRSTPQTLANQVTAPRKRITPPRTTADYERHLLQLKSQHAALSAERNQIDQVGTRQRERVADLEARLRFLRQTLDPQLASEQTPQVVALDEATVPPIPWSEVAPRSSQTPTVTFLVPTVGEETVKLPVVARPQAPAREAVPEEAYRRAVAEAQHWQETAQQLERQIHTLSQLVRVDSLTGLANRRSFDEHLPRAVARAKRVYDSVCLLMIDIDHFKRLNDTHGHPAGDAVLRSVASSIAGCTRPSDLVARYGGEEFAVVLSDVDSAQAFAVAERIRRQVAQSDHCPHPVTVSVGLAEYRTTLENLADGSHEELLAAADKALYAAKHGGRNRVAVDPGCSIAGQLSPDQ